MRETRCRHFGIWVQDLERRKDEKTTLYGTYVRYARYISRLFSSFRVWHLRRGFTTSIAVQVACLPWIRTWRSRKSQFAGWVVIVMLCDICTLSRAGFFRSGRMADWSREACWISNSIFPEYHCKLISSRWCGDGRKIMIVAPAPIITKIWRRVYQLHYQLHCP